MQEKGYSPAQTPSPFILKMCYYNILVESRYTKFSKRIHLKKIRVKVKPFSRQRKIIEMSDGSFVIYVNEPPSEGRANSAVIEMLSDYFNVSKSSIKIVSGYTSKNKIIEIL